MMCPIPVDFFIFIVFLQTFEAPQCRWHGPHTRSSFCDNFRVQVPPIFSSLSPSECMSRSHSTLYAAHYDHFLLYLYLFPYNREFPSIFRCIISVSCMISWCIHVHLLSSLYHFIFIKHYSHYCRSVHIYFTASRNPFMLLYFVSYIIALRACIIYYTDQLNPYLLSRF